MRPVAAFLALVLLAGAVLPSLATPVAAVSALTYDFAPGQSAVAIRTDPSVVRCFNLRLTASLPEASEFAMAGLYVMDGRGTPLISYVQTIVVGASGILLHTTLTTPDGTGLRVSSFPEASPWTFAMNSGTVCLSAPRQQTTIFAAITSSGVTSGRAVFAATDGDVFQRQTVTGTGFAYRGTEFEGAAVDVERGVAVGASAVQKHVTVGTGLLASYLSYDTASLLSVAGAGINGRGFALRACDTTGLTAVCSAQSVTFATLRGGAGSYEFTAASASYQGTGMPGNGVFLLGADIRVPYAF